MTAELTIVVLVAVVVAGSALARALGISPPLLLVAIGVVGSVLPFVPRVELGHDLVLVGLLPPLLYAAAIRSSLVDFRRHARAIGLLSVGLVVITAFAVATVAWWAVPGLSFAAALALGAVVAPPDAVAATAVARRVGMPRSLVTILEGESLVNDATSLALLKTALAALSVSQAPTVGRLGRDFLLAAGGGVLVGVLVAGALSLVRRRISDPVTDTALSLLAPFVAYLPAEKAHASGVLSVVVTGLLLGHWSSVLQSAQSRLSEQINWRTVQFLLENSVFLLIGLQVTPVLEEVERSDLTPGGLARVCAMVLATVVLVRPLWIWLVTYLARLVPTRAGGDGRPPWTWTAVISWAGMRGVVTLAAVLAIPRATPRHEVLQLAAFTVVAGTLLVQGSTLPALVRRLRLPGPDPAEDALAAAVLLEQAVAAGLRRLRGLDVEGVAPQVLERLRSRAVDRTHGAWERLGSGDAGAGSLCETPSASYRRLRMAMLEAEREVLKAVRDSGTVDHEVLQEVQEALDLEEALLERRNARDAGLGERLDDLVPSIGTAGCRHLQAAPRAVSMRTPGECEACLEIDTRDWVHLRACLTCGRVGCCDSSPHRHATEHFRETGHPVMRSVEPGEAWRWCYLDDAIG